MLELPADRILKGSTGATLSWQPTGATGEPADPGGSVTVAVTRAAGTSVAVGAVSGTGSALRSVTVAVAELLEVDWLTAVWSVAGVAVATTVTEVVGGTIGSLAQIRASQRSLEGEPDAAVLQARAEVEDMFTDALNRSPFPRFYRERLDGLGLDRLVLSWPNVARVLWARVYSDSTTYTALTAGELAALVVRGRILERTDFVSWPCGSANVVVAYDFGLRSIPGDLRKVMHHAVRAQVTGNKTGISDRAIAYTPPEGGNVVLATPGLSIWVTGIPGIDEAIKRYRHKKIGVA